MSFTRSDVRFFQLSIALMLCFMSYSLKSQIVVTPPATQTDQFFNSQFLNDSVHPTGYMDWPQQRYFGLRTWDSWASIETANGTYNWSLLDKYTAHANDSYTQHGTDLLYTFYSVPDWAHGNTHSPGAEPSDVASGDAQFKGFVTALMQHLCPTTTTCKIRNFEMWNEFNTGSWTSSLDHLAIMGVDAAAIIRAQCSNCKVIAGSTSGGGTGGNPDSGDYIGAMKLYLAAWKSKTTSMPDIISWHPYPSVTSVAGSAMGPVPFPEVVYSGNGYSTETAGYGTGQAGDDGTSACTVANAGAGNTNYKYCSASIHDQSVNMRTTLTANNTYGVQNAPIWATEGGWGEDGDLQNSNNNDLDGTSTCTGHTPCLQDQLRAGYLARWMILLRADGIQRAYWYAWDEPCWGTLYSADQQGSSGTAKGYHTCNDQHASYLASNCQNLAGTYVTTANGPSFCEVHALNALTPAGTAWNNVAMWLQNIDSHPLCSTTAVASGNIWTCTFTRSSPSGYHGLIAWFVPSPGTGVSWIGQYAGYYPPVAGNYSQWRELLGTLHTSYNNNYSITLGWEPVLFESVN